MLEAIVEEKKSDQQQHPWGISVCVDLYACDPELIRSKEAVARYVRELIVLIDMRAYGACHIVNFGEDERVAGLSMFQFIETSCISGHFANQTNNAYIDIFSCKPFDAQVAADFSAKFFQATTKVVQANRRR